jgi:hypothetical protein
MRLARNGHIPLAAIRKLSQRHSLWAASPLPWRSSNSGAV